MKPTRRIIVSHAEAGQTLAAVLRAHGQLWSAARRSIERSQVRLAGAVCSDPARRVAAGQHIEIAAAYRPKPGARRGSPDLADRPSAGKRLDPAAPSPTIVYADDHIVVVDKPPGLTTMRHREDTAEFGVRARKYLPSTLADLLPPLLGPGRWARVRPVHRLDKETSGLVVFALSAAAEAHLGKQFRAHTIERRYLALVRGRAVSERIESSLIRDRGDARRGSTSSPGAGQARGN